jgi:hypothetical protein
MRGVKCVMIETVYLMGTEYNGAYTSKGMLVVEFGEKEQLIQFYCRAWIYGIAETDELL